MDTPLPPPLDHDSAGGASGDEGVKGSGNNKRGGKALVREGGGDEVEDGSVVVEFQQRRTLRYVRESSRSEHKTEREQERGHEKASVILSVDALLSGHARAKNKEEVIAVMPQTGGGSRRDAHAVNTSSTSSKDDTQRSRALLNKDFSHNNEGPKEAKDSSMARGKHRNLSPSSKSLYAINMGSKNLMQWNNANKYLKKLGLLDVGKLLENVRNERAPECFVPKRDKHCAIHWSEKQCS